MLVRVHVCAHVRVRGTRVRSCMCVTRAYVRASACVCGAGYDVGQLTRHVHLLGERSERCRGCDPSSGWTLPEDQRCWRRRLA